MPRRYQWFAVALVVLVLDFLTKLAALEWLAPGESRA